MKNKKQLLFALGLTVILFLMIISASYLIFSISKLGKEKKTVKSGIMLMNYTGLNNTFSINKTFPTMDKDGKNSKDYFDFTVESNTLQKTNINYEITVKDITSSNRKIDSKYIKLYLTKLDDFENETNVNIRRIAEGHCDLVRNLREARKVDDEKELLAIRVTVLESDMSKVKHQLAIT